MKYLVWVGVMLVGAALVFYRLGWGRVLWSGEVSIRSEVPGVNVDFVDRPHFESFLSDMGFWDAKKGSIVSGESPARVKKFEIIYGIGGKEDGYESREYEFINGVLTLRFQTRDPGKVSEYFQAFILKDLVAILEKGPISDSVIVDKYFQSGSFLLATESK